MPTPNHSNTFNLQLSHDEMVDAVKQTMMGFDPDVTAEQLSDGAIRFVLKHQDLGDFGAVVVQKDNNPGWSFLHFAYPQRTAREPTPQEIQRIRTIRNAQQRQSKFAAIYQKINNEADNLYDARKAYLAQARDTILDILEGVLLARHPRVGERLHTTRAVRRAEAEGAMTPPPMGSPSIQQHAKEAEADQAVSRRQAARSESPTVRVQAQDTTGAMQSETNQGNAGAQREKVSGSDVFISYSHQDKNYAHLLASELKQQGYTTWIDDRIDYGTQWPQAIQDNLEASAAFIVVMTPRSKNSIWVQNELTYAINAQKPIFPLLLEGPVWLSVSAIQCVDVTNRDLPPESFYQKIRQVISR